MKKTSYLTQLIAACIVVLSLFGLIHFFKVVTLPMPLFLLLMIAIPMIFVGGSLIVLIGEMSEPESFVQRFLMLTTFQFLGALSLIAAVWYTNKPTLKSFGIQFCIVFIAMLILQSVLLLRFSKK